jgi:hypothetical protein
VGDCGEDPFVDAAVGSEEAIKFLVQWKYDQLRIRQRSSAKLTSHARSQSAIDKNAATINSQDGWLSVPVPVAVGAAGCVLDIEGVVTDERGRALLTIVTGPRVYEVINS